MWRVIVRISFFHDLGSRLRNHLAPIFTTMGLQNTHTGTWESPSVDLAPAGASEPSEVKNPFELDRRYDMRVNSAADYSSLTGQLFYVHADGGVWVLRYAPLGKEDPNGGSVVLARDRRMDSYREGDLVTVEGRAISQQGSPRLGGALYQVQSIRLVDRPQR